MDDAVRLRFAATEVAGLRALEGADATLRLRRDELRQWQAQRLAATHADLLAQPRYAEATRFFLDELYGAKDFSQRDAELARVIPTLVRFLPRTALATIADAIELDALSERLDLAVCRVIEADPANRGRPIDAVIFAFAYVRAGSRTDRERQIELVDHIGRTLDSLMRHPMIGTLLGAMSRPAKLAGLGAMQAFLESGYRTFSAMRGADAFLSLVCSRETEVMHRLYDGDPDPFRSAGPRAAG
jgi:hypothetical protein